MANQVCFFFALILVTSLFCAGGNAAHPDTPMSAFILEHLDKPVSEIPKQDFQNYSLITPFRPTREGKVPVELTKSLKEGDELYYMRAMPPFEAYHAISGNATADGAANMSGSEQAAAASCRYSDLAKDSDEKGMILMIPPKNPDSIDFLFGDSYGYEGFAIKRQPSELERYHGVLFSEKHFTNQRDFIDYLNVTAPEGEDEPAFVFLDPISTNWDGIIIDPNDPDEFWSFGWARNWG